jgi:hypothetical protein
VFFTVPVLSFSIARIAMQQCFQCALRLEGGRRGLGEASSAIVSIENTNGHGIIERRINDRVNSPSVRVCMPQL